MIISRTPFRISFFGGGTDYHTWYEKHGGAVLSTTINHYCYITTRCLPPFFPEKSRIVWSKIEAVADNSAIEHPSVRAVLEYIGAKYGIELHHMGDLPARSGLGSSSAFTVGMLNSSLNKYDGKSPLEKESLAKLSIHIERDILKENVGIQDQIACAYGGLNHIQIAPNGTFTVNPLGIPLKRVQALQDHCLLFFTGIQRTASEIAGEQMAIQKRGEKTKDLKSMQEMVGHAVDLLRYNARMEVFGGLLDEAWNIKRSLAKNISTDFIDNIYKRGKSAGAIGGKLLGAGGGGFMLFFARPEDHDRIRAELKELLWVPFKFESVGSKIILSDPNSYSRESLNRRDYSHVL